MKHKIHKKSLIPAEVFLPVIETAEYWRSPAIKACPARCLWTSKIGEIGNSRCTWNGVYFDMLIEFENGKNESLIHEAVIHELYHAYDYYHQGQTDEKKVVESMRRIVNRFRDEDWQAIELLIKWREGKWREGK